MNERERESEKKKTELSNCMKHSPKRMIEFEKTERLERGERENEERKSADCFVFG